MTEERALAMVTLADCGVLGVDCEVAWEIVNTGDAVKDKGKVIWLVYFVLRKHLALIWPRQEQKSHLGWLPLFCKLEGDVENKEWKGEKDDTWRSFWDAFYKIESTEKVIDIPESLVCIWSMFRSNWMTDCLSNLSRTEMVHIMTLKEWGNALMMP